MNKNRRALKSESPPQEIETVTATFLRINTRDVLERVKFRGERFLIETFGRPMVVLINYEDYMCIRKYLPRAADNAPVLEAPPVDENSGQATPPFGEIT